jgi:hypothetical protein
VYRLLQLLTDTLACGVSADWEFGGLRPTYVGIQWVRLPEGARPSLVPSQSPGHWITSANSPVGKRPNRTTDHSHTSRAEAKNK